MRVDLLTLGIIAVLVVVVIVCNAIERKLKDDRARRFWRNDDEVGI
jgi:hypothetical protein